MWRRNAVEGFDAVDSLLSCTLHDMCLGLLQEKGTCDKDFWIDVLLTILGFLPG